MSDTSNSGPLYGSNVMLPQVSAAYQSDPRRALVQALMQQGQAASQQRLYSPGAALASALTQAMGGISGAVLAHEYQGINKQALGDLQSAQAAAAGTPAVTDAQGNVTTPATPPDPQAFTAALSKSPIWAPTIAQAQLTAAAKAAEPQKLAPGDQYRGANGQLISANTSPMTDLGKLIQARDALAPNDPNRQSFDAQINKIGTDNGFTFGRDANGGVTMAPIAHGPASPSYIAQKAGAQANAENQSALAYKPAIAGATAAAEAPYKTVEARPGGAILPLTSVLGYQPQGPAPSFVGANLLAAPPPSSMPKTQGPVAPPAAGAVPPFAQGQPDSTPPNLTPQMPAQTGTPGTVGANLLAKPPTAAPAPQANTGLIRQLPGGGVSLANPETVAPLIKEDATEVAEDRKAALAGQKDQATIQTIRDFMPSVKTGWSAQSKLDAANILKAAGVSDANLQDFLSTDVASGQILNKRFLELSAGAARGMGAREPGSVISMFKDAYPSIGTDPQAVSLISNALYMDRARQNNLASQKTNFLDDSVNQYQQSGEYRGLRGFNEQFAKTDPPEFYLHAAEAMSGVNNGWKTVADPAQQQAIIGLIPKGTPYMSPDGQMRMKQ